VSSCTCGSGYSSADDICAAAAAPKRASEACSRYVSTSTQFCSTCGWHRIDHAMSAGGIGHPPRRLRISKRAAEADDV
jgi:hypothetical protein